MTLPFGFDDRLLQRAHHAHMTGHPHATALRLAHRKLVELRAIGARDVAYTVYVHEWIGRCRRYGEHDLAQTLTGLMGEHYCACCAEDAQ